MACTEAEPLGSPPAVQIASSSAASAPLDASVPGEHPGSDMLTRRNRLWRGLLLGVAEGERPGASDAVAEAVGVTEGVRVPVPVPVLLGVGVLVGVFVGLRLAVLVVLGERLSVGDTEALSVPVLDSETVGVGDWLGVADGEGEGDGERERVGELDGVCEGEAPGERLAVGDRLVVLVVLEVPLSEMLGVSLSEGVRELVHEREGEPGLPVVDAESEREGEGETSSAPTARSTPHTSAIAMPMIMLQAASPSSAQSKRAAPGASVASHWKITKALSCWPGEAAHASPPVKTWPV